MPSTGLFIKNIYISENALHDNFIDKVERQYEDI